ncbi:ACL042Wp [Eremothecium gossypii ATCC 10895]|uniref:ACL042Wp n=1 Tax=Eremothecium gossypii (strain ATCC 10895 / CBS 109.51 / FGSC 9923 / NRRL Y-1056) TaxID=284811 RepID=Q75CG1_EREGS|nr:ACL042Wp [Eremothecium gossypii ATCC 10895]AAS51186.1 ACL042Wp [Eremothecium gossypii ATCC 10895]AEY95477.1 FACL042Wp [Eremothecium gossypii FDAG1]
MIFGLGKLFYVILLLVNAVAVLSEERFLRRIGLGSKSNQPVFGQAENSTKSKLVHLISAVQTLLRIPLIGINILVILYELVLG